MRLIVALLLMLVLPIAAGAQDVPNVELVPGVALTAPAVAPTPADVQGLGNLIATPNFAATVGQYGFFAAFWNAIALPVATATQGVITALATYIGGWFAAAVGAMLIALMLQSATSLGGGENPWHLYFRILILGTFCYWISARPVTYNWLVVGLTDGIVNGVSTAMAGMFGGAPTPVAAGSFDAVALKMVSVGYKVFVNMPWFSLKAIPLSCLALAYCVVVVASIGILFAFYLCTFIVLQFAYAIGPLFVAAAFFGLTRFLFYGWLRWTLAAALQQIMIIIFMAMFEAVLVNIMVAGAKVFTVQNAATGAADGGDFASQCMLLIFGMAACVLMCFVAYKLLAAATFIAGSGSSHYPSYQQMGNAAQAVGLAPRGDGGGGGGGGGGSGSGSGSGAGAASAPPPRQYAFSRSVGSAL